MSERIRLLEDALGDLQSQRSTEPHPLLRDDLLGVNQKDDEASTPGDHIAIQSLPADILDSFGTLTITDYGIARFFGPTGGSEVSATPPFGMSQCVDPCMSVPVDGECDPLVTRP
jgi:hypothetical protein